jgi:hypothetical protein
MNTKICVKCKQEKSLEDFYVHHKRKSRSKSYKGYNYGVRKPSDGKMGRCKECIKIDRMIFYHTLGKELQKKRLLQNKYGMTLDDYNQKLNSQGGGCEICKGAINGKGGVDHNHKTGKIRGILCHHCNSAIGNLNDDIRLLNEAINYLKRYGDYNGD